MTKSKGVQCVVKNFAHHGVMLVLAVQNAENAYHGASRQKKRSKRFMTKQKVE